MKITTSSRENQVFLCRIALQLERYDEMLEHLQILIKQYPVLTQPERQLLQTGYKNAIGNRRAEIRILRAIEANHLQKLQLKNKNLDREGEDTAEISKQSQYIIAYRKKIEDELKDICFKALILLSNTLLPTATQPETRVFYLKMQGDYNRYLYTVYMAQTEDALQNILNSLQEPNFETRHASSQVKSSNMRQYDRRSSKRIPNEENLSGTPEAIRHLKAAEDSYMEAMQLAQDSLPITNPLRLGLYLNISVFYMESLQDREQAIAFATEAFEEALSQIDNTNQETYKDCSLILQLIRDNLTLWQSSQTEKIAS